MPLSDPRVRRLISLLYLAGLLIIADQVIEILAALLAGSPAPGAASWRFGAFGVVAGRLSVLLVADAFLFAAAIGLQHRMMLRVLGWIHLALAAVCFAALLVFGLDALEMGGRVRGAVAGPVGVAALRAGGIVALAIGLMIWVGVVSIQVTRRHRRKGSTREAPPLVTNTRRGRIAP